jgi:hypothetical protein
MKTKRFKSDVEERGEIAIYQPDEITKMEVKVLDETVWLTQAQIATIFNVGRPAVTKHIKNIYLCGELEESSTCSILEHMGNDGAQQYSLKYYNLDVILSVGYRVNSKNAIAFRRWASSILKEFLLRGMAVRQQIQILEDRIDRKFNQYEQRLNEHQEKIDFFVRTSLPPVEGIFFDGQIYDAYEFVVSLIKKAAKRIILIDNYIDETALTMLAKRALGVTATIYTGKISKQLQLDIEKHNAQYPPVKVRTFSKAHDRFLILDNEVYLIGASIKDLGKKWFGFTLMENTSADQLIERLYISL